VVETYTADGFPFQHSSACHSHLEKNRVAAHKCRQRKKKYMDGLEARAQEFSSENKTLKENVAMLREEVLSLKNEMLRHAGCGFWAVDEYLSRCAGNLLEIQLPSRRNRATETKQSMGQQHKSADSIPSQPTGMDNLDLNDVFSGHELLRDFDDGDMDDLDQEI
jgi:hypothetical protein